MPHKSSGNIKTEIYSSKLTGQNKYAHKHLISYLLGNSTLQGSQRRRSAQCGCHRYRPGRCGSRRSRQSVSHCGWRLCIPVGRPWGLHFPQGSTWGRSTWEIKGHHYETSCTQSTFPNQITPIIMQLIQNLGTRLSTFLISVVLEPELCEYIVCLFFLGGGGHDCITLLHRAQSLLIGVNSSFIY